jgi:hypothetical protein
MKRTRVVNERGRAGKNRHLVVLGALAISLFLLTGLASAAVSISVGANVNVTKAAGSQAEGTIALNPTNLMQLYAATNAGASHFRSTNGGVTWVADPLQGTHCCDNVAKFDGFGNLFLTNLPSTVDSIPLFTSTNGGDTFSGPTTIDTDTGNGVDQPTLDVGANSVWLTWWDGSIKARGAAVTGLGLVGAFGAEQEATSSGPPVVGQFGDIAVGPSGQVVVTYQSDTQIFVNTDANGLGAGGFGAQVLVTNTNVAKFDFIPAQDGRSIDAEANLAYDRSGGPNNGRLYLVYTDEIPNESNDTDIFVRFSDNNGATWSSAVQVNEDPGSRSQFLPAISLDQTTGNVAVTWHDARNDAGNNNSEFWGAVSDTGGVSFSSNFKISAGVSNDDVAASGVDYGDYHSNTFHAGRLYPIWADNSNSTGDNPAGANSTFDMYTARVTVTPVAGGGLPPPADFDGDGDTDLSVFRRSNASWYVRSQFTQAFGLSTDVPVPGDYDGDGDVDVAVWRPSSGTWYVRNQFTQAFGLSGDIPVPGDYDGDGDTDLAVFRPSNGTWYVRSQFTQAFGLSGDVPVVGDYDGDGDSDLAVFRPSNRTWYVRSQFTQAFGLTNDVPVPGNYDGDADTDLAVFRPSNGTWYVRSQFTQAFGLSMDIPLPLPWAIYDRYY